MGGSGLPILGLTMTTMQCGDILAGKTSPTGLVSAEDKPGVRKGEGLGQLFLKVSLKSNWSTQELTHTLGGSPCSVLTQASVCWKLSLTFQSRHPWHPAVLPSDAAQRLLPAMALRSTDTPARWQIITCGSEKCLLCNWLMENVFQARTSCTGTWGRGDGQSHCLVLSSWAFLIVL